MRGNSMTMRKGRILKLVLCAMFAALTAVGAFLKIDVPPAPISMQYLFVAMAGCLLGAKWGAASQFVYVAIGLVGLPVFTAGGGIMYVFHPTFGFLVGFIAAAFLIGLLRDKFGSTIPKLCIAVTAGLVVLYLIGIPYLYIILRFYMGNDVNFWSVVWSSMILYLPGDAIKTIVAAIVCSKAIPILERINIL